MQYINIKKKLEKNKTTKLNGKYITKTKNLSIPQCSLCPFYNTYCYGLKPKQNMKCQYITLGACNGMLEHKDDMKLCLK